VKAEGNFDYFEGYDGVFGVSWNVAISDVQAQARSPEPA